MINAYSTPEAAPGDRSQENVCLPLAGTVLTLKSRKSSATFDLFFEYALATNVDLR